MQKLLERIKVEVIPGLYVKNPLQTDLGKKILKESIELMDKIGYDEFNFKKLAEKLKTTESSVYRYFENKNRLLLYYVAWYLEIQEYRVVFLTGDATTPEEKIKTLLIVFLNSPKAKTPNTDFDVDKVWRVVVSEPLKSAIMRESDQAIKLEMMKLYQRLVLRVSNVIVGINPNCKQSELLAAMIINSISDYKYNQMHWKKMFHGFPNDDSALAFYTSFYLNATQYNHGHTNQH